MRLDKWLSHAGLGSRSQVKDAIKKGQVKINGITAKDSGTEVFDSDQITCFGKEISASKDKKIYLMMNKPKGYVCATEDVKDETVLSLISDELRDKVFPIGRLDKDTEGLLILTNDGDFCHKLISPKKHIGKTYLVECEKDVTEKDLKRLREGISIGDGEITAPAEAQLLNGNSRKVILTIYEGKYHQVKRMFKATCNKVVSLKRNKIGEVSLDENLKPGEWRELTADELELLNYEIKKK